MAKPSRTIRVYKSYNFRDKDPVIDKVRTVVEDSGKSWQQIKRDSNVSVTTLRGWFLGDTRRPQFCTIAAVFAACGRDSIPIGARTARLRRRTNGVRKHHVAR